MSLALIGCGGGGSGSTSAPPPVTKPPIDGGPGTTQPPEPETPKYEYNPDDFKVTPTDTSGNKVKVGVIDTGVRSIAQLASAVKGQYSYSNNIQDGTVSYRDLSDEPLELQDLTGHGTNSAQVIAGKKAGESFNYNEGFAKDVAEIYSARTSDTGSGIGSTIQTLMAINDLIDRHNILIFNNSYGSDVDDKADIYLSSMAPYASQAVEKGALLVYSAGNDGLDNPSLQGYLASYDESLEKGMLIVAGMANNGKELHEKSNACGVAERFCLTSNFTRWGLVDSLTGEHIGYAGTSNAAPEVTAVAAVIASKYPWMDMNQVRQVLLTTSTFIDDGSESNGLYNKTFGWGYYNPTQALGGIAYTGHNFGDFEANVDNGTYIFSNDIKGDGGIIKSGAGTLAFTGDSTYTGDTIVKSGEIIVNGSLQSSVVLNDQNATLSGTGSVGSVYNNGVVSTEKGRLTVNGDLINSSVGSKLAYGVDHHLTVKGDAQLDGDLTVYASNKEMVTAGEYLVVDSQSLTGEFKSVESKSAFLDVGELRATDKQLYVDVQFADATAAGTIAGGISTPSGNLINQLMVEAAQAKANGSNDQLVDYVKNIQQASSSEAAQSVMNSVSGAMFAETPSVLLKNDTMVNAQIAQRNYQVAKNGKSGAWIAHGQVDTKASAKGWDSVESEIDSLTAGADVAIDGRGLIGAYVTNYNEQSKYTLSNGNSEINLTTLGVYGKLDLNKNVYLSANANYGFGDAEFNRLATDGVNSENSLANADLDKFGVYGEIGYQRLINQFNLSPYLALSHNTVSMDAIKESSEFGVSVNDVTAKETKAHLGLRAEFKATPQLSLVGYGEYAYAIDRDLPMVNLSSNLLNGVSVDYRAPSFDKDYFLYGVGVNFATSDNKWNLFGDLNGNAVNSADQQVQVGLKYNF